MITGANTNVRYRGNVFHVQTEDSGRANPHIISHLYHGGTILGSQKTDYREHLDDGDLLGIVKRLIDEQHAAMVKRLESGGFDDVIAERLGDPSASASRADSEPESKPDTRPEEAGTSAPPPLRTLELDTVVEPSAEPAAARAASPPRADRAFGEGLGSAKPLDEVILDYLCDKARGRAAAGSRPARTNRSEG